MRRDSVTLRLADDLRIVAHRPAVREERRMAFPASMTLPPPSAMTTSHRASRACLTPSSTSEIVGSDDTGSLVAAIPRSPNNRTSGSARAL
jgi:hypothetical protein